MTPSQQGTTLTCQLVGDNWQPLETSSDGGNTWNALPPRTNRAGATMVKMWLKGVTITGSVTATDADNLQNYPNLKGPTSGYRMGLIQVITEDPIMTAQFEGFRYRKWRQRTIPFFDSTGIGASPWYNNQTRADLQNNLNSQVTLQDYPTTITNLRFDQSPQSGRLVELRKCLVFRVFLAVAPKTAQYKQAGIRILKHLAWKCDTYLKFTWNNDGSFSYQTMAFQRSADNVTDVMANPNASLALVQKFPISAQGANETISSSELL